MVGYGVLLLVGEHFAALLQATDNAVYRVEEVLLLHLLLILARGNQCSLIAHIGDIGTAEAWCLFGQEILVHIFFTLLVRIKLQVLHVYGEDSLALLEVGQFNIYLAVETACAQQCLVKHVGTVGGGKHYDIGGA